MDELFEDWKGTAAYKISVKKFYKMIETGEVFVIDYSKIDGSVERKYYRSDGRIWNGLPATEEFIIK